MPSYASNHKLDTCLYYANIWSHPSLPGTQEVGESDNMKQRQSLSVSYQFLKVNFWYDYYFFFTFRYRSSAVGSFRPDTSTFWMQLSEWKQMMCLCDRLLTTKCLKIQFNIGSVLSVMCRHNAGS